MKKYILAYNRFLHLFNMYKNFYLIHCKYIIKRKDDEQPSAISKIGMQYHHIGIPYYGKRKNEKYIKELKIYVSGFDTSHFGIEWMRFEKDCSLPNIIKEIPHIAFEVDDLLEEIKDEKILIKPIEPSKGVMVAFIIENNAPLELIDFSKRMAEK